MWCEIGCVRGDVSVCGVWCERVRLEEVYVMGVRSVRCRYERVDVQFVWCERGSVRCMRVDVRCV